MKAPHMAEKGRCKMAIQQPRGSMDGGKAQVDLLTWSDSLSYYIEARIKAQFNYIFKEKLHACAYVGYK